MTLRFLPCQAEKHRPWRHLSTACLSGLLLAACVTQPAPLPGNPGPAGEEHGVIDPFSPPLVNQAPVNAPLPAPRPVSFEDLPSWDSSSLTHAVEAFGRSCQKWDALPDDAPVSHRVPYAGRVGEWRPACAAIEVVGDAESARRVFEALFTPLEVLPGDAQPFGCVGH